MLPFILPPMTGLLLYFWLRRVKGVTVIYIILLLLTFIPIIPIYFTHLFYTSTILHNTFLILFFTILVASLIQKGIIQRFLAILFLSLILLKGPLFNLHFPRTFDYSEKIEVETFNVENYYVRLERAKQPRPGNDIYHWRAQKYFIGQILYSWAYVTEHSTGDKCIQTLHISRVDDHEKGITTLEQVVNYDTCRHKIVSTERTKY
jgi:hypothetical protein